MAPGVARRGSGRPAAPEPQPAPVPALLQVAVAEDEVVIKKRALKMRMKQQVSALLWGEDLPEGAQARETAEVPYEVAQWSPEGKQHALSASRSFKIPPQSESAYGHPQR